MKWCVPWTPEEVERLVEYKKLGRTNLAVARLLDRTISAVKSRFTKSKQVRSRPARAIPYICIVKSDVPDWYELGWRFSGFIPGGCRMEWRSSKIERRPSQQNRQIVMTPLTQHTLSEMA